MTYLLVGGKLRYKIIKYVNIQLLARIFNFAILCSLSRLEPYEAQAQSYPLPHPLMQLCCQSSVETPLLWMYSLTAVAQLHDMACHFLLVFQRHKAYIGVGCQFLMFKQCLFQIWYAKARQLLQNHFFKLPYILMDKSIPWISQV